MGLSHKLPVHWVPLPWGEELMSSSCMKLTVQQGGQAPMQRMVIHIVGNGWDSPNTEGGPMEGGGPCPTRPGGWWEGGWWGREGLQGRQSAAEGRAGAAGWPLALHGESPGAET